MALLSEGQHLFVAELSYLAPMEEVDALIGPHRAFLKEQYAAGHFLASGAKVPRDGGVIIAIGTDIAEIEALFRLDPFYTSGVAQYRVIEFDPTMVADGLR
ncbi:GTP cyclohydrolase [Thioclava sp. BHET1]|nr:GTP cyclohydrolase [Thioclava sp. BHET1]